MLGKIISGGQTGADRAGLDAAIQRGVPHGGWCPEGRRAEDGRIPDCYQLCETYSFSYLVRTEKNVQISDGTIIFTLGDLRGGSARTRDFAILHGKPWLHLQLDTLELFETAETVKSFLTTHSIRTLNVAGSRESTEPGIHQRVCRIMDRVLA